MPTGFSNEKSAEYVVLYDLYNKVKDRCSFFYPFIYQSKRDNTLLSLHNEIDDLQFIICFARRSKTYFVGDNIVEITFRETLFSRSDYFKTKKIESIIGAPIGTRIEEIGFGAHCQWFYPEQNFTDGYSHCLIHKNRSNFIEHIPGIKLLTDDIINQIFDNAPVLKWKDVIELLQEWYLIEKCSVYSRFFMSVQGQRPIFIAYRLNK
jgi:hypothetical protein